ncbi:MAG: PDZ domain-containing protein [Myxococcota bacterium]|nr:PDZ domain-containing protein [Myxococcota bacterium]
MLETIHGTYFSYRQNLKIIIGAIGILFLYIFAPSSSLASNPSGVTGLQLKATRGRILQVVGVLPDTPAAMVGIKKGDKILAIDGIPLTNMTLKQAVTKLKGAPGALLRLNILRGDESPFDVSLIRALPVVSTATSSKKPSIEAKPSKTSSTSTSKPDNTKEKAEMF